MKKLSLIVFSLTAIFSVGKFAAGMEADADAIRLHIECMPSSTNCMDLPMLNEPEVMISVKTIPDMMITKSDVKNAEFTKLEYGETGRRQLQVRLFESGQKVLAELTKENVEKRMAIVVNDKVISAPVIQMPITEGSFLLTSGASKQDDESFSQLGWLTELAEREAVNAEKVKLYKMLAYIATGLTLLVGSTIFAFRKEKQARASAF